jgi:hypothetical protein
MNQINLGVKIEGFVKIFDKNSGEVLMEKCNAVHYENFSQALAYSVANKGQNFIFCMQFGNGGTSIDSGGVITYLPTNTTQQNADLYNPTYFKIIDDNSILNNNTANNLEAVLHTPGTTYTDVFVSCLLDYGEPANQAAFDNLQSTGNASSVTGAQYIFDELGLKGYLVGASADNANVTSYGGPLLSHVVFHPIQKALNRLIQVEYTVRISALTQLSSIG